MLKQICLIVGIFMFVSCNKSTVDKESPRCIKTKVQEFKGSCCDEGANVKEYEFQGKPVYVFDPGTCGADMSSTVTDEDCNTIGLLGGISGNVKINGDDFSQANYQRTIWEQ